MPLASSAFAAILPGTFLVREVGEDQVVVRAAGDEHEAALDQRRGERLRVRDDPMRVVGLNALVFASCSATAMPAVVWLCGPPCRPGKTRCDRSPWRARPCTSACRRAGRAASCASSSTRHRRARPATDARRRRRARRCARCRRRGSRPTSFAIDANAVELDRARDRGAAAEDQLRLLLARELADRVEIDAMGLRAYAVLHAP